MKTIGIIILSCGICLGIYALTMDTSVKVDYPSGNSFGLPDRVNNIGLMNDKQNYLIVVGILMVVGLVLCLLPQTKNEADNETKQCPQCAEQVKREAKICRFCNYKFIEKEIIEEPPSWIKNLPTEE